MIMERAVKILMSGGLAIMCALITLGNLHDPLANMNFVQHVLSMDSVFAGSAMSDHAMAIPIIWPIVFWLIVAGEGVTTSFLALGTAELVRARNDKARDFQSAKRFVYVGAGCAFLIWFVGFSAVGGEWFAMWQSQVWNGMQAAFRLFASILLILIFVAQPDAEL